MLAQVEVKLDSKSPVPALMVLQLVWLEQYWPAEDGPQFATVHVDQVPTE